MTVPMSSGLIWMRYICGAYSETSSRGPVMHLEHALEDEIASDLRPARSAVRRICRRQAVALVVELEGGDALTRTGDLEVHVAHEVFLAGDVGEDLVRRRLRR